MTSVVSCGVIVLQAPDEILVCRTTGRGRWDLPKGIQDEGESARSAAVRELREETALDIDGDALLDLGGFAYLPAKRLHLFGVRVPVGAVDLANCRCVSTFTDRATGRDLPEVDGYAWKSIVQLDDWCGKNLARVLEQVNWADLRAAREFRFD